MRKLLLFITVLAVLPFAAKAQSDTRPIEVFGGYSYLRTLNGYDIDAHGWSTAIAFNFNDVLALKADVGGQYASYTVGNAKVKNSVHTFMFGPQISIRSHSRATPFAHLLFGGARDNTNVAINSSSFDHGEGGFSFAMGAGLDYKLNHSVSWRLFQLDYLLTRYRGPINSNVVPARHNISHVRVSTGLVIH